MLRRIAPTLLALPASLLLVDEAHAYLDPGTGSILLQGVIGTIAGGLFVIRLYWAKLKTFFSQRARGPATSHPDPEEER